jgi:assimilatory nitrate reductase catalytic subunit
LGGHDFKDPAHRLKVASVLQMDPERIPAEKSRAYDQILEDIDAGKIRALWVVATNSVHSWINHSRLRAVLEKLDFLVVQDLYHTTETAQVADLILPAAGWGEKEGTFINSERRIGLIKKVRHAPGVALADFQIFRLLAHAWGCGELFQSWTSPEAVFQILKELSKNQPCDFTGIQDYAQLDAEGGIQWPFPENAPTPPAVERRLFEDGNFFSANRRARLIFEQPRPAPELVDTDFPFVLLTGRGSSAQWHTLTRTGKSSSLRGLAPDHAWVEIHPTDAARLQIEPHSMVRIRSRRGYTEAVAFLTNTVQQGQIFMPMHFPEVNRLTFPAFDPYSRQPSYKNCAVTIEPAPSTPLNTDADSRHRAPSQ